MIGKGGIVKLGDFELCKNIKNPELNEDDVYEGDSKYLAIELLKNGWRNNNLSYKWDIFSLGMSFAEILLKIELPQSGPLWERIRSNNFSFSEEQIFHSNLKQNIDSNFLKLIYYMISVEENRPQLDQIIEFFPELNIRNKKLLVGQYKKVFDPTGFLINEFEVKKLT